MCGRPAMTETGSNDTVEDRRTFIGANGGETREWPRTHAGTCPRSAAWFAYCSGCNGSYHEAPDRAAASVVRHGESEMRNVSVPVPSVRLHEQSYPAPVWPRLGAILGFPWPDSRCSDALLPEAAC